MVRASCRQLSKNSITSIPSSTGQKTAQGIVRRLRKDKCRAVMTKLTFIYYDASRVFRRNAGHPFFLHFFRIMYA